MRRRDNGCNGGVGKVLAEVARLIHVGNTVNYEELLTFPDYALNLEIVSNLWTIANYKTMRVLYLSKDLNKILEIYMIRRIL